MNLTQSKKFLSFISLQVFFEKHGAKLATITPAIINDIATFEALMEPVEDLMMDIEEDSTSVTIGKNDFKDICSEGVWKLTTAMQYHYALTKDDIAANNVKISESRFYKLSESKFYNFAQMVLNDYQPGVYAPYGIIELEMDALKNLMLDYPNQMRASQEARLKRKMAGQELNRIFKEISILLKIKIDKLVNMSKTKFLLQHIIYYKHRHIGLGNPISGKPQHQGNIQPAQILSIEKHPHRRKRIMYVTNTGQAPLMAGIGLTDDAFSGTPFIILPGKTRQRLSQKLAPAGEFFLLQNIGEGEGAYEIWIKE